MYLDSYPFWFDSLFYSKIAIFLILILDVSMMMTTTMMMMITMIIIVIKVMITIINDYCQDDHRDVLYYLLLHSFIDNMFAFLP